MSATITTTAHELRQIAVASADARGYFAAMYARVTGRIAAAIDTGRFADGERMDAFATTFASYYLVCARDEVPSPRCWQASWDAAEAGGLLIAQHLLLGINAHVNHDLALAVVETAGPDGDLASVRPDFNAVNDVLAETYDDVIADLGRVSRWATTVASIGGGDAFNFSLRVAREQAWRSAVAMRHLDDAGLRSHAGELDRLVAVLAHHITRPPRPARPVLAVLRRFEDDDPAVVVPRLLGED
ncbi:MAG: DUF5995 family protein [Acidimicrobiales bacterium]